MTRFSALRAVPLGALLAIVLLPMWYARLIPAQDECSGGDAAFFESARLDPRLEIVMEGSKATNIARGRLLARLHEGIDERAPMWLAIQRTLGLPNRLLQPAASLPGRREPDEVESKILSTPLGDLPIQYAYERRGRTVQVTAYFMAHRLKGIRSPLWTRLLHGPAAVFGGSWPITLVTVAGRANPTRLDRLLPRLDAALLDSWAHYRAVCGPASDSRISDSRPL